MNLKKGFWRLAIVLSLIVLAFFSLSLIATGIGEKNPLWIGIGAAASSVAIVWAMFSGVVRIYLYIKQGFLDSDNEQKSKD